MYAVAFTQVPVFNKPSIVQSFFNERGILDLDHLGLIRSVEMIAFCESVFLIKRLIQDDRGFLMYEVKTSEYPIQEPMFIPASFVQSSSSLPKEREKKLPSLKRIVEELNSCIGVSYIWGGNYRKGIARMMDYFPEKFLQSLDEDDLNKLQMKGVDCSGLMYEVSGGTVPRNSSWYLDIGVSIQCEGLSTRAIVKQLKPLDAIIWPGHIVFMLDDHTTIEVRAHRKCVFTTNIFERLEQIETIEKRRPLNDHHHPDYRHHGYVIRRWYEEML